MGTPILRSYLSGSWLSGQGKGQDLVNPSDGSVVAFCSSEGLDFGEALAFARAAGGPALRALTFTQRAALLGKVAETLAGRRDRWFEIARVNSGNTKADVRLASVRPRVPEISRTVLAKALSIR
jgi:acyl-CoA reductase-like NAD-dependent aldehyde dehydrogenase